MRKFSGRTPESANAEAIRDRSNRGAFVERFASVPGFSELEGNEIDVVMETVAASIGDDYQKWNSRDIVQADAVQQAVESIIQSRRQAA